MEITVLAERLVTADQTERAMLLSEHPAHVTVDLASALKAIFDAEESNNPAVAGKAAVVLQELAARTDSGSVHALAAWVTGMAAQLDGRMELALEQLDAAASLFDTLGQPHTAASTQVSKLITLAIVGRYDEAMACGIQARDLFLAAGDLLAAGKVEQNLGNIEFRRDRYHEAEHYYHQARAHFLIVGDQKQLAQIDNCLATALTARHEIRQAAVLYQDALARAETQGLAVTQAEIECNLGCLFSFEGRYDLALDYLERSRRKYVALDMAHESAIQEQELADVYLELNLAPEAANIYERVIPLFESLGMRAEQARAVAYYARASQLLDRADQARGLLDKARLLYAAEDNQLGAATMTLFAAQMDYADGNYSAASRAAAEVAPAFALAGARVRFLLAGWLHGESRRLAGELEAAEALLESTRQMALEQGIPQIGHRCSTSLGLVAAKMGDMTRAEDFFKYAVQLIEELRAPLPAAEFRAAFLSDKLTPYIELVRLCLASGRDREAHEYVERIRSRALADMLAGVVQPQLKPRDAFEAELLMQLREERASLNQLYTKVDLPRSGGDAREMVRGADLHVAIRERELRVAGIARQLQQRAGSLLVQTLPYDVPRFQNAIGTHTAIIEYFSLDDELLAFVITDQGIEVVRGLGREAQCEASVAQFHFQLGAFQYGTTQLRAHLDQLADRACSHLQTLYDVLLRPLEHLLGSRRLLIIPHRSLHYVPFHALHDGNSYVIERCEVSYAPSLGVWRHCLSRPKRQLKHAVVLGVADSQAPRVRDEVMAITNHFPSSLVLLDEDASIAALQTYGPSADVLHMACHGQFRPDSPLFSALQLADGRLTVRDVYDLDLHCQLVVLSACETGMSQVAPGDELSGLARAFFSAGAASLVVSLWSVADEATAALMDHFYARLSSGDSAAAALRSAQCTLLDTYAHPFFWAPFVVLGRS